MSRQYENWLFEQIEPDLIPGKMKRDSITPDNRSGNGILDRINSHHLMYDGHDFMTEEQKDKANEEYLNKHKL